MQKKDTTIFDRIDELRLRPAMYLGKADVELMNVYLTGYDSALSDNNLVEAYVFPPFYYFHEWTRRKCNSELSTAGWAHIIKTYCTDKKQNEMDVFYDLIDGFRTLRPVSVEYATINDDCLFYHKSEACPIKRYVNVIEQIKGPVHENADEIFLIEISDNFGFCLFVRFQNNLLDFEWRDVYLSRKEAKKYSKKLFGENLKWEPLTLNAAEIGDSIMKGKTID